MNFKIGTKIVSLILSVLLIFEIVQTNGEAFLKASHSKFNLTTNAQSINSNEIVDIVEEIKSDRDEYSKVFLLKDGSYYEVVYSFPIHYYSEGKWENKNGIVNNPSTTVEADELLSASGLINTEISQRTGENNETNNNRMIVEGESSTLDIRFLGPNNTNTIQGSQMAMWLRPLSISNVAHDCQIATVNAKVTLNVQYFKKAINSNSTSVKMYEVQSNWDNNTNYTMDGANGSTQISYSDRILDLVKISSVGSFVWDITDIYSSWERDIKSNKGVLFTNKGSNATVRIGGCSMSRRYRIIGENDSDFSYQSIDMGRAGVVYLNDYTSTIRLERNECALNGNRMPVNISRIINFAYNTTSMNFSGAGSRWNYSSNTSLLTSDTIRWFCFDGNMVYFTRPSENIVTDNQNRQRWAAKNYDGYLWVDLQATLNDDLSNNYIEGNEGISYFLDTSGRVISAEDVYGNECLIVYAASGVIDKIVDGSGRCFKFTFGNIAGLTGYSGITSITAYTGIDCSETIKFNNTNYSFSYGYCTVPGIANGFFDIALNSVTYPDGETVAYTYDSEGRLSQITNNDGTTLEVTYINSTSKRVSCLLKTKNSSPLQKIEIDSHNMYLREITINDTTETIVHYNTNLDIDYKRVNDGTEYYYEYDENGDLKEIVFPEDHVNLLSSGDFEGDNDDYWFADDGTNYDYITENGNTKLQISANENLEEGICQLVEVNGQEGDCYAVYATMCADGTIPLNTHDVVIEVYGLDEYDDLLPNPYYTLNFDTTIVNENQYRLGAFQLDDDNDYLVLYIHIRNQTRYLYFDNIGLYQASDNSIVELSQNGEEGNTGCSCVNCQNGSCNCECGLNCNPNCVCCNTQRIETRDSYGNVIKSGISIYNKEYATTNSYVSSGNYLSQTTDVNNVEIDYYYNSNNGSLERITEGTDEDIFFSYNAMGVLTEVTQAVASIANTNASVQYSYTHDKLSTISHNGITYNFVYDDYGNCTCEQVKDSNQTQKSVVNYTYNNNYDVSTLNTVTYGNGATIHYVYNNDNNISEIYLNNELSPRYTYIYNSDGTLMSSTDNDTGFTTTYSSNGGYTITDSNNQSLYSITSNNNGQLIENVFGSTYSIGNEDISSAGEYSYDCLTGESNCQTILTTPFNTNITANKKQDAFCRVIQEQYSTETNTAVPLTKFKSEYEYNDTNLNATNQIAALTTTHKDFSNDNYFYYGINDLYEYDSNGRLIEIERTKNLQYEPINQFTQSIIYEYDSNGQIIRENNQELNKTFVYNYNPYGNISSVEIYQYTTSDNLGSPIGSDVYSYDVDYCDLLSSFNNQSLSYDAVGNPLTLGSDIEFQWHGKQMISYKCPYTVDDNYGDTYAYQRCEFKYDSEGNRTGKSVYLIDQNDIESLNLTTIYIWDDGKLVAQETINPDGSVGNKYKYLYDVDGEPYGIIVNNSGIYYYVKDQFGSVIEIYAEANHKCAVSYKYDAWGNTTYTLHWDNIGQYLGALLIAMNNSITYKGYFYDEDINLYYLQSRYYNPQWRRFVNSDRTFNLSFSVIGSNLYGYCLNNPVKYYDTTGKYAETVFYNSSIYDQLFTIIASMGASLPISPAVAVVSILVAVIALAAIYSSDKTLVESYEMIEYASTAPTPPPPNKGGKGTKVDSKTLYNKKGRNGFRIDVENPGNRQGQIHLQRNNSNIKYIYDVKEKAFRIKSSSGPLAPSSIQDLLSEPKVIKAIAKGLKILGY